MVLFLIVFLLMCLSILALLIGLIRPAIVIRWGKQENKTRMKVLLYYGASIIICFVGSIVFAQFTPEPTPEELAARAQREEIKVEEAEARAKQKEERRKEKEAEKQAKVEAKAKEEEEKRLAIEAKAQAEAKALAEEEEEKRKAEAAKASEHWDEQNIVDKLNELNVLNGDGVFTDNYSFGTKVVQHESSSHGKTKMKNAYVLDLSIVNNSESSIKSIQTMTDMAFNIAQEIYRNQDKLTFNLCMIEIHFPNTNNAYGAGGDNFSLGINTITRYFKEPRTSGVSVDKETGATSKVQFDSESFYDWIEEHFTLPEDHSVLSEDTAWTLTSEKAKQF